MAEEAKKTTKKIPANKKVNFMATGRRKQSIARVRLFPNGKGTMKINGVILDEYFGLGTLKQIAVHPLTLTDTVLKYDVEVNVHGGGLTG